jgi:hypothetical protein
MLLKEYKDFQEELFEIVEKISNVINLNDHHKMEMDFLMDINNFVVYYHLNMYLIQENYLLKLNFDYEDIELLNKKEKIKYLFDKKIFPVMSMSFVEIKMFDHLK